MKKIILVLAVLFVGFGYAQDPVYRLESKGPGRVLAITDTVNNIPKRYPDINIFADVNALGNVEIFLVEKPKVYVPIQFNGQRGIPYTQFIDGDNADATFANADAVTLWFDTNFNTAGGSASPTVDVTKYGAKGDNSTDDTDAIQAAVDYAESQAASSKGIIDVVFPSGTFIIGGAGIVIKSNEVRLKGSDVYSTRLKFKPTADGQICVKFAKPIASVAYSNGIKDLSITTSDILYNKTALSILDGSNFLADNLHIHGFTGPGTDGVGIETFGRQGFAFQNVKIFDTTNPIYLRRNPNTTEGYLSVDHFNFHNLFVESLDTTSESLVSAIVLIEDGVHLSHLSFTGLQAWVGADYGLYWVNTGVGGKEVNTSSTNILLENVRRENNSDADGYSVFINLYTNRWLNQLTLMNCQLGASQHGLNLDFVHHTTLINTDLMQDNVGTGRIAIQYPSASSAIRSKTLNIIGCEFDQDALLSTGNLQRQFGTSSISGWGVPSTAFYAFQRVDNTPSQHPTHAMGGLMEWSFAEELVNNDTFIIPIRSSESVAVARIEVTAATTTGIESGVWLASNLSDSGVNGVVKLSGTTNTVNTDTTGNLCVYSTVANIGGTTIVKNRLGSNAWVVCKVYLKKTTEK